MDIARAFTYVTEDENWQNKVLLTLIIGVIPIVNLAAVGWMLDLIRNMLSGAPYPMPDWDDLSSQFVDRWVAGLMTALAGLLYIIPLIVINIVIGIGGAIIDAPRLVGLCTSLLGVIYFAVIWMPLSIAMMRYSSTRDFSHYLQFTRNIQLVQEHMSVLIVLAVVVFVIGFILGLIGNIPCIGWLITLFSVGVNAIVVGHLTGQAAIQIKNRSQG
jgi:hypothetical protein